MPRHDDPRGAGGHGHRVEGRVIQVFLFLVIVLGFLAVRVTVVEVILVGVVECGFFNGQQACFGQLFEGGVNDLGGEHLVAAVPAGCGCQCQVS
jgi:hypothetical protein